MKNFITQMQHQHETNLQLASLAKDLTLIRISFLNTPPSLFPEQDEKIALSTFVKLAERAEKLLNIDED